MFYIAVGDYVRLSHWPRDRKILVTAIGDKWFLGKEPVHNVETEGTYSISEAWELVKVITDIPVGVYGTKEFIPIGIANRIGNQITIKLVDTDVVEQFYNHLDQAVRLMISVEYAAPAPFPEDPDRESNTV